jgi:uncharacterized phiE125 gp8 family phage protein
VVALRTLTAAGVSVVIAPSSYVASVAGGLGRIRFLTKPPEPERTISGIEIDVELGFSSNSQGVPETLKTVRRQNIWLRLGLRLAEFRPHHGVDIKRRSCGAASVDVG